MRGALTALRELVARARAERRDTLLETEALALLAPLGIRAPVHRVVEDAAQADALDLEAFPGPRVVVKVLSPEIAHRSEVGGVAVVPRSHAAIAGTVADMAGRLGGRRVAGYGVFECVEHDRAPGGELLLGLRWTADFGPVLTFGLGGVFTEHLTAALRPGRDVAILSPGLTPRERLSPLLAGGVAGPMVTGALRGQEARMTADRLATLCASLLEFAAAAMPAGLRELEINPLVPTADGPVALDALARVAPADEPPPPPPRPLHKLANLLRPERIAVIGVSRKRNPGRIIVENLVREGFPLDAIRIVKPGGGSIEGIACVDSIADLEQPVDLLIVGVDAAQVPEVVEAVVTTRKAESMIVIPGGLGERAGTEDRVARVTALLERSRATDWGGPVLNGGNCLGVRSRPGGYDTLFIPEHKLPSPRGTVAPVAVLSQSGAFAVAQASRLGPLNPRYLVSIGNQADLTVGDYLTHLAEDDTLEVFACYVEGFRPLDGRRFLEAAARITRSGRTVLLYRAGRTPEGAEATVSHTASIAGDYAVTRALAAQAGVILVDELADFEDLVRLIVQLRGQTVEGLRLAALTNAGFESVAFADNLGPFTLAPFSDATRGKVAELLAAARLDGIVAAKNPLDVTPILPDEPFARAAEALLHDEGTDVAVIGCVPLSGALNTVAAGGGHDEDVTRADSVARRLAGLKREGGRAWVAVVDAGRLYDPMAALLEDAGVPTFRSADRALRLFGRYCGARDLQNRRA